MSEPVKALLVCALFLIVVFGFIWLLRKMKSKITKNEYDNLGQGVKMQLKCRSHAERISEKVYKKYRRTKIFNSCKYAILIFVVALVALMANGLKSDGEVELLPSLMLLGIFAIVFTILIGRDILFTKMDEGSEAYVTEALILGIVPQRVNERELHLAFYDFMNDSVETTTCSVQSFVWSKEYASGSMVHVIVIQKKGRLSVVQLIK